MNFSKLFLMMALGVSLNNVVCGMEQDDNKKRKREDDNSEQSKKNKKEYPDNGNEKSLNDEQQKELNKKLFDAAQNGNLETLKQVVAEGADINACCNDELEGVTALMMAVATKHIDCTKFLIEKGANLDMKVAQHGTTALKMAIRTKEIECVKLLLDNGANPNIIDSEGNSDLMAGIMIAYYEGQVNFGWYVAELVVKARFKNILLLPDNKIIDFVNELPREITGSINDQIDASPLKQEIFTVLMCSKYRGESQIEPVKGCLVKGIAGTISNFLIKEKVDLIKKSVDTLVAETIKCLYHQQLTEYDITALFCKYLQ